MNLKFDSFNCCLLVLCFYLECVFTLDPSNLTSTKVKRSGGGNLKTPVGHSSTDTVDSKEKIEIPLTGKDVNTKDLLQQQGSLSNTPKETSQLALEGGGIIDLKSTAQPNTSVLDMEKVVDDTNHSKGSKPRKGVQDPSSSVVPRKGVDPLGAFRLNQSLDSATTGSTKDSTGTNKQILLNKTEVQKPNQDQQQLDKQSVPKAHPKKPVVVTDIEDADDFDKYPIIQTSTTGEDYIIIGIVIVLGIWCSIFGALIFYRRAGEYWDRRHYRRMDFLVEGMYND